jgi:signal transduction histidine kinase
MFLAQIVSTVALICYLVLLALTLRNDPRRRENQAFALYLAAMIFWQFSALLVSLNEDPKVVLVWYRLMTAGMGGQFIFYAFFICVFLDAKLPPRLSITGWLVFLGLIASSQTDLIIASVVRSEATHLLVPVFGLLVPLLGVVAYTLLGYSIYRLVRRYRGTRSSTQRERLKYLLLGSCVIALGSLSNLSPVLQHYPIDVAANLINGLLIAYAIGRHRLLDIIVVMRRGLSYTIPSVIIGMGYLLTIALAVGVFHVSSRDQVVISLVTALLIVLIAQPLHSRAQEWIDRLFFRERYDSNVMLERLSRKVAYVLDLHELTDLILEQVAETIHIEKAAIFLKQENEDDYCLIANRGYAQEAGYSFRADHPVVEWLNEHESALSQSDMDVIPQFKALWGAERAVLQDLQAQLFIPLKAKANLVGIFMLGPKLSGDSYTHDDQIVLTTLANQIAVAIENARLYSHLQRTLAALRQAHDELETRVIQRTADLAQANQALEEEIKVRKHAEEVIHQYTRELERSNQELQQFAYVASHDLQEPLRMVSSYLQLLERRYREQLSDDARDFIDFAVDGAKRMQALIDDLLAYSRVGTRGKPFTPVALDQVVEHAVSNLGIALRETQATVVYGELPVVEGDSTQLVQLFQNLIGNALKFHSNQPPRIRIIDCRQNGMAEISVADNGIGIDPDYAERIFLIFQRLHTREEYPGNGIGLAICKRIIERHGGKIWVDSKPGSGSTFHFTLPVHQETQS